ncbi:nucleoside deaminase [candidate division KSB1 bacterium]|nr:nucleoside deaminase [candidate division KSB1 bacterium]
MVNHPKTIMKITTQKNIILPSWVDHYKFDTLSLMNDIDKMELVIELAQQNILKRTGGPFSALVINSESNEVVSVGLNLVESMKTSIAHAEIVALLLAQANIGNYRLHDGTYELISLAQPCSMCYGAIFWSGIKKVIYGATKQDVQEITGFDEGPLPSDWIDEMKKRDISIISRVNQKKACEVLSLYVENDGLIY